MSSRVGLPCLRREQHSYLPAAGCNVMTGAGRSAFYTRPLSKRRSLLLLAIPLVLSAYTHLWNPAGFPFWHTDEGTYIERALGVLDYEILHDKYDHPFLGQIVLAGFLHAVAYPDSLITSVDPSSLGMLYGIPRVLMGLLAVLDTFLVYKIAKKRFGRRAVVSRISIRSPIGQQSFTGRSTYCPAAGYA